MTNVLVPCPNEGRCGHLSHRPDSTSFRMCLQAKNRDGSMSSRERAHIDPVIRDHNAEMGWRHEENLRMDLSDLDTNDPYAVNEALRRITVLNGLPNGRMGVESRLEAMDDQERGDLYNGLIQDGACPPEALDLAQRTINESMEDFEDVLSEYGYRLDEDQYMAVVGAHENNLFREANEAIEDLGHQNMVMAVTEPNPFRGAASIEDRVEELVGPSARNGFTDNLKAEMDDHGIDPEDVHMEVVWVSSPAKVQGDESRPEGEATVNFYTPDRTWSYGEALSGVIVKHPRDPETLRTPIVSDISRGANSFENTMGPIL